MLHSNGEIGSLVQDDKQIGGFIDWTIDLQLRGRETSDGKVYTKPVAKSTALKFWLLSSPSQSEIKALYYQLVKDTLALINESTVQVDFGEYELNKIINRQIEIKWMK